MFNQTPTEKTQLEEAIEELLREMSQASGDSEEYEKMVDQLVKLHALKTTEGRPRISADVKATIIANLLGIAMIIGHERTGIVTSKALGFIKKLW
jgi:hypothetical protein